MSRTISIILISILFIFQQASAGTRYRLNSKTESLAGIAAISILTPALTIDKMPDKMPLKSSINSLDRSAMFAYNKTQHDMTTVGMITALMMPGVTVLDRMTETNTLFTYATMYAEAFVLAHATKELFKSVTPRYRPYLYFSNPPDIPKDRHNSFPSGHTTFAFLGATFLATTFPTDHPDSKWSFPLIASGYTLATGIGIMRVTSGNHYITDVLAGAAIGSFYGWLIPHIHLAPKTNLTLSPTYSGFQMIYSI